MSSRTSLLVQAELYHFQNNKAWISNKSQSQGIELIDSPNLYEWTLIMSGPKNTCWENARFRISIKFTRAFSESPPLLFFLTVPFHPNIDLKTGKPCTAILEDGWRSDIKIAEILVYLQNLLAEPELTNPINVEAAEMYTESPKLYEQLARDAVLASKRFELGMPLFEDYLPSPPESLDGKTKLDGEKMESFHPQALPIRALSFDEYYQTWKKTSTTLNNINPARGPIRVRDLLKFSTQNTKASSSHLQDTLYITEKLKIGHFRNSPVVVDPKKRVQDMKKMYATESNPGKSALHKNEPNLGPKLDVPDTSLKKRKILLNTANDPRDLPVLRKDKDAIPKIEETDRNEIIEHLLGDLSIPAISTPELNLDTHFSSTINNILAGSSGDMEPTLTGKKDTFWDEEEDDLVNWATNLPAN